jgi:hypothetical protein
LGFQGSKYQPGGVELGSVVGVDVMYKSRAC